MVQWEMMEVVHPHTVSSRQMKVTARVDEFADRRQEKGYSEEHHHVEWEIVDLLINFDIVWAEDYGSLLMPRGGRQ